MTPRAFFHRWVTSAPLERSGLAVWRQRILRSALLSGLVLGFIAYVPSMALLVRQRLWNVAVVDTVVYGWLVVVAIARHWPYRLRAGSVVAMLLAVGVSLLVEVGPLGPGLVWLAAAPVVAAILLGLRTALAAIAVTVVIVAAMAVGLVRHVLVWPEATSSDVVVSGFLVSAVNALVLGAAVSLAIDVLLRGLEHANRALAKQIEDRHRAEAEREQLSRRLHQAQKLEALGTLAGGIAHDFNNLLVPILANAELIRQDLPADSPHQRRLRDMLRSAERARDLVRRILGFSRHAVHVRVPVRLDDTVGEIGMLIRAAVPSLVRIEHVRTTERATVMADPIEIHQIVMNLATNAAYAMRERGGTMTIAIGEADQGRLVRLSVRDTGGGMDRETLDRAFDPFFTTKPPGEGSGLGLATVHGVVADLGGRIEISSEVGQGTTVDVLLPRVDAPPIDRAAAAPAPAPLGRERTRVLVVDDEPDVLEACRSILARYKYETTAVGDPREAIALVAAAPDGFELLVTDQSMSGMSGIALAQAIRAIRADIRVLLVSGFIDEETRQAAAAAGIHHVLSKPYTAAELIGAIAAALAGPPPEA